MRILLSVAAFLLAISHTAMAHWVSGRVEDVKGAGIKDVVVSDGYSVVKSDSAGTFFFNTSPAAKFIFVSTPDGFDHEGGFYHRLDPSSESYTFKLVKRDNYPGFFIHTGDTEASVYKDWVTLFKSYVNNTKPAFVLLNGDICYEKGMRFHAKELNESKLGVRTVYTLGNHDLVDGPSGEALYEELFGPVWYSFNINGVHFVNLPVLQGDRKPGYTSEDVYTWLKNDLEAIKPGTPVIIFNHHLVGFESDFVLKTTGFELDLKAYNLKAYLYAHYHTNMFHKTSRGGVTTISSMSPNKGGINHSPSSFRVINFNSAGEVETKLIYSPLDKHVRATGYEDETGSRSLFGRERKEIKVVATIYDTPSNVTVANAVAGKKEYKMTKESDFTWSVSFPSSAVKDLNSADAVKIKAEFSDGSVIVKPADIYSAPVVSWRAAAGGVIHMVTPVITDKYVITATADDESAKKSAIVAFEKSSGKIAWKIPVDNSVKNRMEYWNGMLYAADVEGKVYAADVSKGSLKWSRELRRGAIHPSYNQGVVVYNDIVYAGQGDFLTAMRAKDGKILWVNTSWRGGVTTVASPVVEPGSGVLLTSAYWTGRFAHSSEDGKLLWEKRDNDTRIADNSPVAFGGSFFYTSPNYITEVDPLSGEERVKRHISYTVNSYSKPLVTDKYYIVGTTDKGVVAFNRREDYREMWNFRTNPALIYTAPYTKDFQLTVESSPLLYAGDVYFGANDGYVYCVNAETGVFKWRFNTGSPNLASPVIESGVLYIADFAGNIWALKL